MNRTTLFITLISAANLVSAAPWTYRGTLNDGGKPANGQYDLRLTLVNATDTASVSQPITLNNVAVKDGNFAAEVDFGFDLSNAPALKLKTEVQQNGSGFASLGEPSAFDAKAALAGICWDTTGNVVSAGEFLGSTNSVAVEVRAANTLVANFTPRNNVSFYGDTPSVALGSSGNVASGAGATVGGGGATRDALGGVNPGFRNSATGNFSTTSGGVVNNAQGFVGTVSGGYGNTASGDYATVAGGDRNIASGIGSAVGGGFRNIAAGNNSFVAAGDRNLAGSSASFAGGSQSRVRISGAPPTPLPVNITAADYAGLGNNDDGTFVWADDQNLAFTSTGPRQFLIRAQAGMAINTNTPTAGATLTVAPLASASATSTISMTGAESTLSALSGDLRLNTFALGKYIHTNDRFGVKRRPIANVLEVEGDASKTTAGAWLANSDRRIKTDIATIPNALDRLSALRPVTFHYTPEYLAAHPSIKDVNYYNVIAQEFQKVFPDAVKGSGEYLPGKAQTPENEILQVDTYPAQIVAIAAIQELNAKLELENAALRERLAAIEAKLSR